MQVALQGPVSGHAGSTGLRILPLELVLLLYWNPLLITQDSLCPLLSPWKRTLSLKPVSSTFKKKFKVIINDIDI